jgi:hypothetical protein
MVSWNTGILRAVSLQSELSPFLTASQTKKSINFNDLYISLEMYYVRTARIIGPGTLYVSSTSGASEPFRVVSDMRAEAEERAEHLAWNTA